jgi:hypothetical protein
MLKRPDPSRLRAAVFDAIWMGRKPVRTGLFMHTKSRLGNGDWMKYH